MALIGTISGSNGTSTTAISGSLIIADEPGSRFPTLTNGIKLFVSGNKTQLGSDSPVAVFGGDTFVSGAFGTDSYIQMKPVNTLRIPTNTTASYIYTSGSTNDLYFTQYNGPYTNTTRLRWLESALGTGLLNGGTLSTANGTTTFSVVSGSGIIVTQNASLNSEPFPTINQVRWSNVVSQSLTYVASDQITYISVDSAGSITQSPNPLTIAQKESSIYLGRILHQTGSITNGSITEPAISYGLGESTFNFQRAFGPLKISGHVLAVSQSSGLGTLGLIKTAGDSYVEGRNYTLNPNSPNLVLAANDPALTDCKIFREYTNASDEPVIDSGDANAGYTVIDPTKYNNAGTLSSVSPSQWTNQRVFWFPRSVNRALFVYYGPAVYGSYDDAIAGISSETFTEGANTVGSAVFVGVVTVKANETTLDSADSKITQAALHRGAGFGGGGGGSTAPGGSDTYVQFNDGGGFGGDSGLTYNKTTDSLTVAGNITGSNLLLTSGFVVTGSGIIESNTSTAALRVTQQGSGNAISVEDSSNPDSTPFVVTADGRVGVGTTTPTAYVFVTGSDSIIPVFVARASDSTVDTFSITGSGGANTGVGFVNINQGNYSNKYALTITNVGSGTAGFKVTANTTGVGLALDNMNSTPQFSLTHKNLWFNSVSTAFDTSQVTYKFIENNKAATYPNQKTFLISGNTNGPKTGSYFEVEKSGSTGPIKILELQGDTTDNALFVSGAFLTSGSITTAGSLAVNGGNITSTAATVNIANTTPTTVNIANNASNLYLGKTGTNRVVIQGNLLLNGNEIQASGGATALTFPSGNPSGQFAANLTVVGDLGVNGGDLTTTATTFNLLNGTGTATTVNFGGATTTMKIASGSGTSVEIGSSAGRTTVYNDLVLGSGNLIVTNNATPITLVSSGNITMKLDANNDFVGHKFVVQDWRGINQFTAGEDGNAEISGSLVVSGSSIQTVTTTTYNLLTTALTGTLNVGSLANSIIVGGTTTTSSFTGATQVDGRTTLSSITEKLVPSVGGTGTVSYDLSQASIFYVNNPAGSITVNFTNVPTLNNRILTPTVILSQSATPRTIIGVQIDTAVQTIDWANGVTPTANANKQDVFGFSLIRSGSNWKVLGQLSTYG